MVEDRTFDALVFDWDGTAVPDRAADAAGVRRRIEALCAAGVHVFVVSGTHVGNVEGQLHARPSGPGELHYCLNRGSEVFRVGPTGPEVVHRRIATPEEDRALDFAASLTVERLHASGVEARIVSQRLNRRKIDVIPEPAWDDPPKARIDELLEAVLARLAVAGIADLGEVLAIAAEAARTAGLSDPRITSDVKHVEIGLTDKSDSARWAASWLACRGVTGRLVLVAGDEFGNVGEVQGSDSFILVPDLQRAAVVSVGVEPRGTPDMVEHLGGGPARFLELLDEQLARRAQRRVPEVDDDPDWTIRLPAEPALARVGEALAALGTGLAGTRASREEDGAGTVPLFVVSGVYTGGSSPQLVHGPSWTLVSPVGKGLLPDERTLDMRTAVLARRSLDGSLRSLRFAPLTEPHALAFRVEAQGAELAADLDEPAGDLKFERERAGDVDLVRTSDPDGGGVALAFHDHWRRSGSDGGVERLAAWDASEHGAPPWDEAIARLTRVRKLGFDRTLADHRAAWAERWANAEVTIEGNATDQLSARFAVFHLLSAVADTGEAAVGARGLTGDSYGGHVFWDADVFVLPVLAAINPPAARAMLEYRIRRLSAARAEAAARGLTGARFPWESAADGRDVTPRKVRTGWRKVVAIRTGEHEEHIVADIAWAANQYAAWTGDRSFLTGEGRDLLVDTARYWADRVRTDPDGAGHLFGVMGPDEYHEVVDDNAYTNLMARWNLRRGAELLVETGGDIAEARRWREIADALVDGWDPDRQMYEQFAGYWALEPLLMRDVAEPPATVDLLIGAERVASSQLIKQADVLMAHHLLPDDVMPGSLARCLDFYEPRCAHGSSLSPAIHASLLARAGRPDDALELFRLAARLDLDDVTGTTAGGVHLAAMGGVWQALAFGFLGLAAKDDALRIDPSLPEAWDALALRFRFGAASVRVRADHAGTSLLCDRPVDVVIGDSPTIRCEPPGRTFRTEGDM